MIIFNQLKNSQSKGKKDKSFPLHNYQETVQMSINLMQFK